MEVKVPKEILQNIKSASKELGLSEKEVIAIAIRLYLKNLKEYVALQEEIHMLEETGINDSNNFLEKYSL